VGAQGGGVGGLEPAVEKQTMRQAVRQMLITTRQRSVCGPCACPRPAQPTCGDAWEEEVVSTRDGAQEEECKCSVSAAIASLGHVANMSEQEGRQRMRQAADVACASRAMQQDRPRGCCPVRGADQGRLLSRNSGRQAAPAAHACCVLKGYGLR